MGGRFTGRLSKEDSSFSEEKEAKRLLGALRGRRRATGVQCRLGARATNRKKLFSSLSA
jgi:hypothetical protein